MPQLSAVTIVSLVIPPADGTLFSLVNTAELTTSAATICVYLTDAMAAQDTPTHRSNMSTATTHSMPLQTLPAQQG